MLNPHRNRRPMTRLTRCWSLGVLALAAIVVGSLQVADGGRAGAADGAFESDQQDGDHWHRGTRTDGNAALDERLQTTWSTSCRPPSRNRRLATSSFQLELHRPCYRRTGSRSRLTIRSGSRSGVDSRSPKLHDVQLVSIGLDRPGVGSASSRSRDPATESLDPTEEVGDIDVLRSVPELDPGRDRRGRAMAVRAH